MGDTSKKKKVGYIPKSNLLEPKIFQKINFNIYFQINIEKSKSVP